MMFIGMILCFIMLGLGTYEVFGDWFFNPKGKGRRR